MRGGGWPPRRAPMANGGHAVAGCGLDLPASRSHRNCSYDSYVIGMSEHSHSQSNDMNTLRDATMAQPAAPMRPDGQPAPCDGPDPARIGQERTAIAISIPHAPLYG